MSKVKPQKIKGISEICSQFNLQLPKHIQALVAGKTQDADITTSYSIPIVCPATEETLYELIESDACCVDQAVCAARKAFDDTNWSTMSQLERKSILMRVRDAIALHSDELAALQSLEVGLPITGVKAMHMPRTLENFDFFISVAETLGGETYQQMGDYLSVVTKEPVGVAVLIAPWNAPLVLLSMKLSAALAMGNSCVIKASEYAPYSVLRFVEILHEAGLPPGVVNLVNGRGEVTGKHLVEHSDIDVIGFVGGTQTGANILRAAATGIKKVSLELGGKSANIVFESANIDKAVDGSLLAILSGNGQQCFAGSRIFVQRGVAEQFIAAFTQRMSAVKIGDPFDTATELGPMAFAEHRDKVLNYASIAREQGAQILTGGGAYSEISAGYYVLPTAVLVTEHSSRVCQEEIFGPFVTIMVFDTVEQAVSLANDSEYGLVCYLWSDDLPTVMEVSGAIKAGTIWVNTPMARDLHAPFGGYKKSGLGRDGIHGCVELFTEEKTTMLPTKDLTFHKIGMGRGQ